MIRIATLSILALALSVGIADANGPRVQLNFGLGGAYGGVPLQAPLPAYAPLPCQGPLQAPLASYSYGAQALPGYGLGAQFFPQRQFFAPRVIIRNGRVHHVR